MPESRTTSLREPCRGTHWVRRSSDGQYRARFLSHNHLLIVEGRLGVGDRAFRA